MSTPAAPTAGTDPVIVVISHTGLLYWWPVWLVGFVLSVLTWFGGERLAIVPAGTKIKAVTSKVYQLTVPARSNGSLDQALEAAAKGEEPFPVRVSASRDAGTVFMVVLLLVVFGSNVPLRGLWSVIAILVLLVVAMLLAYFGLWGPILERLGGMHIEISLAGYLLPSVVLLVLWLATVFGFDRLRYIRFTAGQFVVHKAIGDAQEVYDTTQVNVRKRRSDLFRHWVLGLGAGDLIVYVPAQNKEIVLPDVLFVDRKVQQIADLMKTRPVLAE
jgi:hypothetical protein